MVAQEGVPEAIGRRARGPGEEGGREARGEDESEALAFLDIETEAWDRFALGGLLRSDGSYFETDDSEALYQEVLAEGPGVIVYAWNGGRFDFLWWLEEARRREQQAVIGNAGKRIQVKEGPTLRDAVALIPLSLAEASAMAGLPVEKDTGLPCTCTRACGGYCSIKAPASRMETRHRALLSTYLRRDCEAGLAIVRAALAEGAASDYTIKGTIGQTAYATARRLCGFQDAEWTPGEYFLTREGYYGGWTEVFRPRARSGHVHDIRSAYPWALSVTPLPVGERITITGDRARRAFHRGKEGVYRAEVEIPAMFIPPLPVRVGDRIIRPIGAVAGAWTRIELAAAIEAGVVVTRWGEAIVWETAELRCKPFVDHVWSRRARAIAARNKGFKKWHKLVGNSFTGKCAQKPELETLYLHLPKEGIRVCDATDCRYASAEACDRRKTGEWCCRHECTGWCGAHEEVGRPGSKLWRSKRWRIPECGHIHWAAYLTARTRIELRAQLTADGEGGRTALYCDTDSCFSTARRTRRVVDLDEDTATIEDMLAALGTWSYEGKIRNWHAPAPKVRSHEGADGIEVKAKGVPELDAATWSDFSKGAPVLRDRGVLSLKQAARGESLFTRKNLVRRSHADGRWFGGRVLGSDGRTYPVTLAEFEAGQREREKVREP